jgi:error-prone DNA polymerase
MSMLFERFISRERNEPPDIDVDFEHERREEVIQYIYAKYGRERAALAAVVITYQPRSALRDVGKALGLSPRQVDARQELACVVGRQADTLAQRIAEAGSTPRTRCSAQPGRRSRGTADRLSAPPVPAPRRVRDRPAAPSRLVPVENAAMPDRTVIQWDKDDLDALGLLKVDVLGLGMLSCHPPGAGLVNAHRGTSSRWRTSRRKIPAYAMISKADTIGVFQIESRAQMAMLPRLRPRCFYDLVIEVAIVRPGPIQGDMVHPYLRRRQGEEPVTYPSPKCGQVLERTLGVPSSRSR